MAWCGNTRLPATKRGLQPGPTSAHTAAGPSARPTLSRGHARGQPRKARGQGLGTRSGHAGRCAKAQWRASKAGSLGRRSHLVHVADGRRRLGRDEPRRERNLRCDAVDRDQHDHPRDGVLQVGPRQLLQVTDNQRHGHDDGLRADHAAQRNRKGRLHEGRRVPSALAHPWPRLCSPEPAASRRSRQSGTARISAFAAAAATPARPGHRGAAGARAHPHHLRAPGSTASQLVSRE